jgi:hypothetical protein
MHSIEIEDASPFEGRGRGKVLDGVRGLFDLRPACRTIVVFM